MTTYRFPKYLLVLLGLSAALFMMHTPQSVKSAPTVSPSLASAVSLSVGASTPLPIRGPTLPNTLTFAGEKVPVEDVMIRERLERELTSNMYRHGATILAIKRAHRFGPMLKPILREHGVPEDFFYLAVAESNLDVYARSPKNAEGVWQFLKATARQHGLEVSDSYDERRDPIAATHGACRYLKKAYQHYGNWTLAAAAYNRGTRGLNLALENQRVKSYYDLYLNKETYRYVFRILALKLILQAPERYGFEIPKHERYAPWSRYKTVSITKSIDNLPDFAKQNGTTFLRLKNLNPSLSAATYALPFSKKRKKPYVLRLPN